MIALQLSSVEHSLMCCRMSTEKPLTIVTACGRADHLSWFPHWCSSAWEPTMYSTGKKTKRDYTFAFDWNMLSSSSPEESHESPPEWLKEKTIS